MQMTLPMRRPVRARFGLTALAAVTLLAACDGDSFGWTANRIDYSFAFQVTPFGRNSMGRCHVMTQAPSTSPDQTTEERLIACHMMHGGKRYNCSFFRADAADFPSGRTSGDERIAEACYEALYDAYFGLPEENPDARPADDGGYTPPPV